MSSLQQKINDDLKGAMKSGDEFGVGVLRMLTSSLHNKEIEKRGKGQDLILLEEEIIEILSREAKKRKEAAEIYRKGGRNDLAEKEDKEINIIKKYLPEQLSEGEIEKVVISAIEKIGANDIKELGKVMGEAMKELKGRVEAGTVSMLIKKRLGGEK